MEPLYYGFYKAFFVSAKATKCLLFFLPLAGALSNAIVSAGHSVWASTARRTDFYGVLEK